MLRVATKQRKLLCKRSVPGIRSCGIVRIKSYGIKTNTIINSLKRWRLQYCISECIGIKQGLGLAFVFDNALVGEAILFFIVKNQTNIFSIFTCTHTVVQIEKKCKYIFKGRYS